MPSVILIPEHLQCLKVLFLTSGLLQYLPKVTCNDGVGGNNQCRLSLGGIVYGRLVDIATFLLGGLEDVLEGPKGLVLVFCGG